MHCHTGQYIINCSVSNSGFDQKKKKKSWVMFSTRLLDLKVLEMLSSFLALYPFLLHTDIKKQWSKKKNRLSYISRFSTLDAKLGYNFCLFIYK